MTGVSVSLSNSCIYIYKKCVCVNCYSHLWPPRDLSLPLSRQTLNVAVLVLKAGRSQKPRAPRGEKQSKSIEAPGKQNSSETIWNEEKIATFINRLSRVLDCLLAADLIFFVCSLIFAAILEDGFIADCRSSPFLVLRTGAESFSGTHFHPCSHHH
ncbi:hypothetical protein ILYODFUR_032245 [Ilyodon furcidens]|uniref:Uncharacterized protein n=1 Tax=Ilyodon furcidens TaxID=33524 RepID=A0ABV0TSA4_9TELE